MDLKQIKGIGPAKQEKLKTAGITSVHELARCDIAKTATETGLPESQVRDLKQRATAYALLEDLKGFGPATLTTLSDQSSASLKELYEASADWLAAQAKVAEAHLHEARERAEALARHVAEGAKTPEGRRQLAQDARAAAGKAAHDAEAAGRRAYVATREVGRELSERAPELLAQAQAGVKVAEERLKEASAKAESVIKAEAQKAKAHAERVVAQTRQRFNRAS